MTNRSLPVRREILHFAAVAAAIAAMPVRAAGEPPPETRRIRIARFPFDLACVAPMWIAEELLRAEGFEAIEYMNRPAGDQQRGLADGELDFAITDIFSVLPAVDTGMPTMVLCGIHSGCYELFANPQVRSVRGLKGKSVVVANAGRQAFVSAMVAHVGLDPRKDLTFLERPGREGIDLLAQGKVDAFLGFAPEPQEMRARKIGLSVVNTATDRPWSQYFCCVAVSHRDFTVKHPVATRRALRAFLKAADICATEPDRVVRTLIERGFLKNDAYAAQALGEIPYKRWREYDSADSLRFYALRLHEAGVIKTDPQKLLARCTDWRFIEQLKKELKT